MILIRVTVRYSNQARQLYLRSSELLFHHNQLATSTHLSTQPYVLQYHLKYCGNVSEVAPWTDRAIAISGQSSAPPPSSK